LPEMGSQPIRAKGRGDSAGSGRGGHAGSAGWRSRSFAFPATAGNPLLGPCAVIYRERMAVSRKAAAGKKDDRGSKAKLPLALAKRAEGAVAAKRARLAEEGRADIALVIRRQANITEAFYDIGEALVRLKRAGVAEALGRATFREVCERDLSMSLTSVEELIAIVTHVKRKDAVRMGQARSRALVALAKATPETDTATSLAATKRDLPSGKKLDVAKASVRELHAAAKDLRAAQPKVGRPKGRTTTPEERARAAGLQAALHGAGLTRARVAAVATKPGQEADVRIEGVPMSALDKLRAALGKKG
jgi:hypothetical protein